MDAKLALKLLFGAIFTWMIVMTVSTHMNVPIWEASFTGNPWAWATLWDAYFGFVTFYVWVLYKEPGAGGRILWFFLIMLLGNIAMSLYVLIELFRLQPADPVEKVLWRRA